MSGGQLTQPTDLTTRSPSFRWSWIDPRALRSRGGEQHETARLRVAGRSAALQLIAPALAPDRPVPRGAALKTLMFLGVGFILSTVAALLYDASAAARQTPATTAAVRSI